MVELELMDYLRILRKRFWLILSIVIVACLASGLVSYFVLTPVYEASTKLIVNRSSAGELPGAANQADLNELNYNLRLIDTYKEIIKTTAIMDRVAAENPQFGLTSEQLIDKIQVNSVNNSQVMTLRVQDPSYRRAAEIVNAVSVVFQQEIVKIFNVNNVSILDKADPDKIPAPIKPNKKLNVAISFVLAVMAGAGLAFLLEYLDDTIKSEKEVEQYLNLPVLATIERLKAGDIPATQTESLQYSHTGGKNHATIG